MIKRRFYRFEHGDRDAPSESSSSSSGSEVEEETTDDTEVEEEEEEEGGGGEAEEEEEEQEENFVSDLREKGGASSSSGYESEDSSANEVNLDSSGLPTSDDDVAAPNGGQNIKRSFSGGEGNNLLTGAQHNSPEKDETQFDIADCVLKVKSVFKCRLCPRIVCLSEETLKAHLNSKRHARSEKLRREGRLKLILNDDGKIEGEMNPENNHAETAVSGQKSAKPKKKSKGRWQQRKRSRQDTKSGKAKPSTKKRDETEER